MTTSFAELGLNEHILAGVEALGFEQPTPVQARAIPLVLEGRDLVASAQTGTGKTAAFALPTLQLLMELALRKAPTTDEAVAAPEAEDATKAVAPAEEDATQAAAPVEEDAPAETSTPTQETPAGELRDGEPRKRRRRRRHKRKPADAPDAPSQIAADADNDTRATSAKASMSAEKPTGTAEPVDGADPAAVTSAALRDGEPRRRRRRRRRGKSSKAAAPEAAAATTEASAAPARPAALVVTPTRELAQQIERVTTTVCAHTGQRSVVVMGGTRFDRQLKELARGCDLLVATPGRLIDLMEHKHVDLSHVRVLVLDEADRMLDMGFWPSVRRIIAALPAERQNLLFSATIPPSIKGTIDAMLHDPATVEIARVGETADTVEEHLMPVTQGQKTQLLQEIVRTGGAEPGAHLDRVLVFCRTKHRVDDVSRTLKGAGFVVEEMHSDRPQRARDKALERFRAGEVQLLVATDVMSRGIDVSGIDAVVNFDVPMDPEDYVHRIGRTGRAGATGHAYTFVAPDEITPLREIEYFTHKLVPVWDLPGFAYDGGRIVPNAGRATSRASRTMFSGSKGRRGFGGPSTGRFGRHY
jgi:ATP-dependent RNA helicase RhlE